MNVVLCLPCCGPFAMDIIHPLPHIPDRPRVQTRPGLINSFWLKRLLCWNRMEEKGLLLKITTRGPISKRWIVNIAFSFRWFDGLILHFLLASNHNHVNQYRKGTNNHVWCVAFLCPHKNNSHVYFMFLVCVEHLYRHWKKGECLYPAHWREKNHGFKAKLFLHHFSSFLYFALGGVWSLSHPLILTLSHQ